MTFAWIDAEKADFPITTLCQTMQVSPSGFDALRDRPESAHTHTDRRLRVLVRASFEESKQRYGSPRVHEDLIEQDEHVSRKRVVRFMQEDQLVARLRTRFKRTTMSDHDQPVAANLLDRRCEAKAPNQRWVGDTTDRSCASPRPPRWPSHCQGTDTNRAIRRGPRSLRAPGAVLIGRVSPAQYGRSLMNRLPAKTKGPIRVHSSGHAIANGHARLMPEASGETTRVAQSLDRVLSLKLLRFPAVRERTGLSRSTIWRLERHGDFPKHRRITANVVAWVEAEVMSWIHSKVGDIAV